MPSHVSIQNAAEKLHTEVTQGYANLSKWIIALSTGAIAFGVTLVRPNTAFIWKQELFFGLGLIVISILSGVRYVRLTIDHSLYNLGEVLNTKNLIYFKGLDQESEYGFGGKNKKVSDIVKEIEQGVRGDVIKMENISKDLVPLFSWQQWLFYIGIILIAFFGVLSIN